MNITDEIPQEDIAPSRSEGLRLGLNYYYGRDCYYGHSHGIRYVSSKGCAECKRNRERKPPIPTDDERKEWRIIPSNPTHEVSEDGTIRRAIDSRTYQKGWVHSSRKDKDGYLVVTINSYPRWIHRLVAEVFIGTQPNDERFQVQHKDGIRTNNHYTNLKWGDPQENSDDMKRHGNTAIRRGEESNNAKLTWEQVRSIRKEYAKGGTRLVDLSERYNVTYQLISKIIKRKIWHE